jgi:FkbM family methyltransferase
VSEISPSEQERIENTTAVRDCDPIPKVENAGAVEMRDGHRVQVMHNGVLIEEGCYYGAWTTEIIRRLRGHHEPQEEPVFHAIVERLREDTPRPAMLELGSFWSYYSLWLRQAIPATSCVLVEPDPNNLAVGRRNFALNGAEGSFIHAAVGEVHDGTIRLPCESDRVIRRVRTVTVDGLLAELGIDRLDVLVCDTQGAEAAMLRGARAAIAAGRIRFLLMSTHHHSYSGDPLTHQRCLALVREAGGHVIAEHTVAESCSGDGLIAASFDPRDQDLQVPLSVVRAQDSVFGAPEYELARAMHWYAPAVRGFRRSWERARQVKATALARRRA